MPSLNIQKSPSLQVCKEWEISAPNQACNLRIPFTTWCFVMKCKPIPRNAVLPQRIIALKISFTWKFPTMKKMRWLICWGDPNHRTTPTHCEIRFHVCILHQQKRLSKKSALSGPNQNLTIAIGPRKTRSRILQYNYLSPSKSWKTHT